MGDWNTELDPAAFAGVGMGPPPLPPFGVLSDAYSDLPATCIPSQSKVIPEISGFVGRFGMESSQPLFRAQFTK